MQIKIDLHWRKLLPAQGFKIPLQLKISQKIQVE